MTSTGAAAPDGRSWGKHLPLFALLAASLAFLVVSSLSKNLNHDEHQFLAPGVLLAQDGLLPFRDYPLFHLPNLAFVYAGLDLLGSRPLLIARMFSVVCAFGVIALIVGEVFKSHGGRGLIQAGLVLLLLFDPLFAFTTGRAWNHDLPALLIVAAVILQVRAAQSLQILPLIASAVCSGLAAGTRLTYAPILVPLWFSIWFFPATAQRRTLLAGTYFLAATLALAPSLYFLAADRDAFLFGNFAFPRLRLLDPADERVRKTLSPLRKIRFFFKEVALPSAPLFVAFVVASISPALQWWKTREPRFSGAALVWAVLPFAVLGCFAPSRYQYQHYFVVMPLLALGVAIGLSAEREDRRSRYLLLILVTCVVSSLSRAIYKQSTDFRLHPEDWTPNRVERIGTAIKALAPAGKCLTLAPAYPMEGGIDTYPEFATGPFAWRSAHLVPRERRQQLRLVAPDDLEALLTANPPGSILTGFESSSLEKPLEAYARAHAFTRHPLRKGTLWLPLNTAPGAPNK